MANWKYACGYEPKNEAVSVITAKPTHDACAQLLDPAFIEFAGQSGHTMPLDTDFKLESISGMLELTPMPGSTATSNIASVTIKHAKYRVFSRVIVTI